MQRPIQFSVTCLTTFFLCGAAFAHPPSHDKNADTDVLMEKIEDKLSDHKVDIAKSTAKMKRKLEKSKVGADGDVMEDLEVVMDVMEEAFSDDGLFRTMAAMFGDFAEDLDIDTDDGKTVLMFDGEKVGQIEHKKSRDNEDSISISGLGKYLTFDRETIVEDGKSKTRIVIDMDGEDELDITLPDLN